MAVYSLLLIIVEMIDLAVRGFTTHTLVAIFVFVLDQVHTRTSSLQVIHVCFFNLSTSSALLVLQKKILFSLLFWKTAHANPLRITGLNRLWLTYSYQQPLPVPTASRSAETNPTSQAISLTSRVPIWALMTIAPKPRRQSPLPSSRSCSWPSLPESPHAVFSSYRNWTHQSSFEP